MNRVLKGIAWLQTVFSSHSPPCRDHVIGHEYMDLSIQWQVLGPFPIGTREATWGADPLTRLGGFPKLLYNQTSKYYSSLGINGTVGWTLHEAETLSKTEDSVEVAVTFDFPQVDWTFLQSIYGWAALQFQAWARGDLLINASDPRTVVLYTDNVLEFLVDGEPYFGGDFYAYRRAPLLLRLSPGAHRIDVRLVRDVRAMGGMTPPLIHSKIKAEFSTEQLVVLSDKIILPEMVDGVLASHLGSVPIRNDGDDWIEILGLECPENLFVLAPNTHRRLAPGQSRPLNFQIGTLDATNERFSFVINFTVGESSLSRSHVVSSIITKRMLLEPHKYTFFHPSGIVSYAILQAPKVLNMTLSDKLPILLNLHGAGLEADSHQVRHMLDSVTNLRAWTIFPTGVTPWSGDDWHTWGFADVQAAIAALPLWIEEVGWTGPSAVLDEWYVTGHSNGGQGTWFALSHQPDMVMAAAPVSGYSSIQAYVPYQFWTEMEPGLMAVLQTSLVSYRHELFIDNFAGIPILQQHGGHDDNVPVYHSRRLRQLIDGSGWSSKYVELSGKGHWFEGIMTTEPMCQFYDDIPAAGASKPILPDNFSIVTPSSGDMGTRGGIQIDQLVSPDQLGRINVVQNKKSGTWSLRTSNVRRFHVSRSEFQARSTQAIEIDGSHPILLSHSRASEQQSFVQSSTGSWSVTQDDHWKSLSQRYGSQLGALDAILRTKGPLLIQSEGSDTLRTALQISRNLYQYFAADCPITESIGTDDTFPSNVISVFQGTHKLPNTASTFPVDIDAADGFCIRDSTGRRKCYPFTAGLGALFLHPLPAERLQLVVWGYDEAGLRSSSRLVPMLTGVGQADFIVTSPECSWKGAAGVLAAGFFDSSWNVSTGSYMK
ncbi:hypothetical protein MMC11_002361 [Xylographa trunciseda]|nr:hypothetical protein [Xylographa trunciseda]